MGSRVSKPILTPLTFQNFNKYFDCKEVYLHLNCIFYISIIFRIRIYSRAYICINNRLFTVLIENINSILNPNQSYSLNKYNFVLYSIYHYDKPALRADE